MKKTFLALRCQCYHWALLRGVSGTEELYSTLSLTPQSFLPVQISLRNRNHIWKYFVTFTSIFWKNWYFQLFDDIVVIKTQLRSSLATLRLEFGRRELTYPLLCRRDHIEDHKREKLHREDRLIKNKQHLPSVHYERISIQWETHVWLKNILGRTPVEYS